MPRISPILRPTQAIARCSRRLQTAGQENQSMRVAAKYLAVLIVVLLIPASVFAQASLTGVVRDSSGGVLPGVTLEAASPAMIEKVRSAVTDSGGLEPM